MCTMLQELYSNFKKGHRSSVLNNQRRVLAQIQILIQIIIQITYFII